MSDVKGGREYSAKLDKAVRGMDMTPWVMAACLRVRGYSQRFRFRNAPTSPAVPGILTSRSGGAGLRGAITATTDRQGPTVWGRVGVPRQSTAAAYGPIHEFGGWAGRGHHSHIRPRPYLGPALNAEKENINRDFKAAVLAATRGAGL
jgi:hypothetical protein